MKTNKSAILTLVVILIALVAYLSSEVKTMYERHNETLLLSAPVKAEYDSIMLRLDELVLDIRGFEKKKDLYKLKDSTKYEVFRNKLTVAKTEYKKLKKDNSIDRGKYFKKEMFKIQLLGLGLIFLINVIFVIIIVLIYKFLRQATKELEEKSKNKNKN